MHVLPLFGYTNNKTVNMMMMIVIMYKLLICSHMPVPPRAHPLDTPMTLCSI